MKKKELLNEIMGVSKSVDFWTDYLTVILAGMAKGITQSEEIEETDVEYSNEEGEEFEDKAYRGVVEIKGKEFTNWVLQIGGYGTVGNLFKDPRFKHFPLYNVKLTLVVIFLPEELVEEEVDSISAQHGFDTRKKLISKVGKNEVFVNQEFAFRIILPKDQLDNIDLEQVKRQLKPTISHELNHAFETYSRVKTTGDPYMGRESFLNVATQLMSDNKYPQWREFLFLVYLHLGFEINARIPQFYYSIKNKDIKTTEEFLQYLKKSSAWQEAQMLEDFDAEKFIDSFQLGKLDFIDILKDIGEQQEREKGGLPIIVPKKSPEEGMKHLIQGWDYVLQRLNLQMAQGPYKGKFMEMVPQSALENPYYFFKFFEKRFHKKAKRFKKKLYNISTLIFNKELMDNNLTIN